MLPILRASAIPGGRVTSEPLGYVEDRLLRGLAASLPLDGVLLCGASLEGRPD